MQGQLLGFWAAWTAAITVAIADDGQGGAVLLAWAWHQVQRGIGVVGHPPEVLMEHMRQWVRSGPALVVAKKGPPLAPFREVPMEVEANCTKPT